ncbi:unnamed protein product [Thlaspi arvense]|uniref:Uncharacterized protein n=1 Tax=Thlaspi arvense TaxID=13288 RepID=A0AAU9R8Y0_THLAR|nr:unnamed protein product [Thlaspi arvense]
MASIRILPFIRKDYNDACKIYFPLPIGFSSSSSPHQAPFNGEPRPNSQGTFPLVSLYLSLFSFQWFSA